MHLLPNPDHKKKSGIYAKAKKASRKHIAEALEMVEVMDASEVEWAKLYDMKAWAIAHGQFNDVEEPLRIFVVHPLLVAEKESPINARFPARAVFNPVILEAPKEITTEKMVRKTVMQPNGRREIKDVADKHHAPNVHTVKEGCMSFPKRKPKNVTRVFRIKVQYQYPVKILGVWVLRTKTETVEGLKAQVFQHEIQHFEAENIFYASTK